MLAGSEKKAKAKAMAAEVETTQGDVDESSEAQNSEESGKAPFLLDNFKRDPLLLDDDLGFFLAALELDVAESFVTFLDCFKGCASVMWRPAGRPGKVSATILPFGATKAIDTARRLKVRKRNFIFKRSKKKKSELS